MNSTKLNAFRKSKGLTIKSFAKEVGYSYSATRRFLYREREPSIQFLKKLKARFPDADMNELI